MSNPERRPSEESGLSNRLGRWRKDGVVHDVVWGYSAAMREWLVFIEVPGGDNKKLMLHDSCIEQDAIESLKKAGYTEVK